MAPMSTRLHAFQGASLKTRVFVLVLVFPAQKTNNADAGTEKKEEKERCVENSAEVGIHIIGAVSSWGIFGHKYRIMYFFFLQNLRTQFPNMTGRCVFAVLFFFV